jgi:two-component sensor histidine kinase
MVPIDIRAQNGSNKPGASLYFDGIDDQIIIPEHPELKLYQGTLEAWIKIKENDGKEWHAVIAKELSYELTLLGYRLTSYDWTTKERISYGPELNDNKWHHIAFVFADKKIKGSQLYLDGNPIGASFRYNILDQNSNIFIGNNRFNPQYFDGNIDEVRIWNRPLNAKEIKENYNHEVEGSRKGLLIYFKFNQGIAGGNNQTIYVAENEVPNLFDGKLFGFQLIDSVSNFVSDSPLVSIPRNNVIYTLVKYQKPIATGIIIGIVLYLILRWRTQYLLRRNKILEELVKQKTERLTEALNDKDLLIKEIHHRVKNNLQVISGLLELQKEEISDEHVRNAISEGQSRVRSVALIHHNFYQHEHMTSLNFKTFVPDLVKNLAEVFSSKKQEIEVEILGEDHQLDLDTIVSLGLILNELITNAFKYACSPNNKTKVTFHFSEVKKGNFKLIYHDNGPGINGEVDFNLATSLGLRLIKGLIGQLHGTVTYQNNNGAEFIFYFKNAEARSED